MQARPRCSPRRAALRSRWWKRSAPRCRRGHRARRADHDQAARRRSRAQEPYRDRPRVHRSPPAGVRARRSASRGLRGDSQGRTGSGGVAASRPGASVTNAEPVLLVIDDEPGMLTLVERIVRPTGFKLVLHTSARDALDNLAAASPDVALVDLQMPELGGLDVLRAIREIQPQCGVILMTAYAAVDSAIEAVKLGALDYLAKPLDIDRLRQLLSQTREDVERRAALLAAENQTAHRLELCGMIGRSAVMQELFGLVRRIAPHARTALVTGETGAGKEGVARAIHELGPRRQRKFVTINCSAIV